MTACSLPSLWLNFYLRTDVFLFLSCQSYWVSVFWFYPRCKTVETLEKGTSCWFSNVFLELDLEINDTVSGASLVYSSGSQILIRLSNPLGKAVWGLTDCQYQSTFCGSIRSLVLSKIVLSFSSWNSNFSYWLLQHGTLNCLYTLVRHMENLATLCQRKKRPGAFLS